MRILSIVLALTIGSSAAQALEIAGKAVRVTTEVTGLDQPWAVAELPEGGLLVTERGGALLLVQDGRGVRVKGAPRVAARGQGGLLDVTLARDFATSRTLFLTYSKPHSAGARTTLAAAELAEDGRRLENLRDLFVSAPGFQGGRHFGARVVEGRNVVHNNGGSRRAALCAGSEQP